MNLNWSSNVIKYVLFVFNLIFVITGISILAVGVSVKAYYYNYSTFLDDQYFSLPNLLIAIGSLIFFISFFGCCGAIRSSWCMVYTFSLLLILIFILEFSAGIAGYVLRNKTADYLDKALYDSLKKYDMKPNTSSEVTIMWDLIQQEFECCGVKNMFDWKTITNSDDLPASCCVSLHGVIGPTICSTSNSSTSTVFNIGCEEGFGNFVSSHALTIGSVGLAIAFIQLFGIIFACHLSRQIKNSFYST